MHIAIQTLREEAEALRQAGGSIDYHFAKAVDLILDCNGKVVITGLGKSGLIGRKIASTMASTGTPSIFVHSAEAPHGDYGMISNNDVVIAISYSGKTREVIEMIPFIKGNGVPLVVMTGNTNSELAMASDAYINCFVKKEACPNGLAPTSSAIVTLALGDALAMQIMHQRDFKSEDYAKFHPGGSLGRKLAKCSDIMRTEDRCPYIYPESTIAEAIYKMSGSDSAGLINVVDRDHHLVGVFTDGDLRRAIERNMEGTANVFFESLMSEQISNRKCMYIYQDKMATEALAIMEENHIDTLPVVNDNNILVGIIDIQDLIGIKIV